MPSVPLQYLVFPYKTVAGEPWDEEWAKDWHQVVEIFDNIDRLEELFNGLHVSDLRELSQKQLIINLRKYAYSLHKLILEKYSDD